MLTPLRSLVTVVAIMLFTAATCFTQELQADNSDALRNKVEQLEKIDISAKPISQQAIYKRALLNIYSQLYAALQNEAADFNKTLALVGSTDPSLTREVTTKLRDLENEKSAIYNKINQLKGQLQIAVTPQAVASEQSAASLNTATSQGSPVSFANTSIQPPSSQTQTYAYESATNSTPLVPVVAKGGPGSGTTPACVEGGKSLKSDEATKRITSEERNEATCIQFENLNTIKYKVDFNQTTSTTAGPDLSKLPFFPPFPSSGQQTAAAAPINGTAEISGKMASLRIKPDTATTKEVEKLGDDLKELDKRFNEIIWKLNNQEQYRLDYIQNPIIDRRRKQEDALAAVLRLADQADVDLQSGASGVNFVLKKLDAVVIAVNAAEAETWPDKEISTILNEFNKLTKALDEIRFHGLSGTGQEIPAETFAEWLKINQGNYDRARKRIGELTTEVNAVNGNSAPATAFNQSRNVLRGWQSTLLGVQELKARAFTRSVHVSCHTVEAEGKTSKLSINKFDRTTNTSTSRDVLSVHCYSRVAITGGFNFSTIDEKEFSIVQSAGATPDAVVKKFGFTKKSSFRPNPLLLLNVRFTENPVYNWHVSFGALVDTKGQTGTDVEPVGGVSFSIRRIIFITPLAVHFGRTTNLAGGFQIGDTVPEAVTTPPTEKTWKVGYTGGITFRIAPN